MPQDPDVPRSRRAVIGAAVGGAAALAAGALARPLPAAAANSDGQPLLLGDIDNTTVGETRLTSTNARGFLVRTSSTASGAAAIAGTAEAATGEVIGGVFASSSTGGRGVVGEASASTGDAIGGYFSSASPQGYAIRAVVEHDGTALSVASLGTAGSFGSSTGDAGNFATSSGRGVFASSLTGVGVFAFSEQTGKALVADVTNRGTQVGLEAYGRVRFPNRSGKATVKAGSSSVTVKVSGVTSSNLVVATLNSSRSGRWVRAAYCGTGSLTIRLNTTVSSDTRVGWIILG